MRHACGILLSFFVTHSTTAETPKRDLLLTVSLDVGQYLNLRESVLDSQKQPDKKQVEEVQKLRSIADGLSLSLLSLHLFHEGGNFLPVISAHDPDKKVANALLLNPLTMPFLEKAGAGMKVKWSSVPNSENVSCRRP
jgi:hypothetical protein